MRTEATKFILWFKEISKKDVPLVGGKNASLGEMFNHLTKLKTKNYKLKTETINVPDGFALTSNFYWQFIKENDLQKKLEKIFSEFDPQSLTNLQKTGQLARELILKSRLPEDLKKEVSTAYQKLCQEYRQENSEVAVRSSGVAEDAPENSFAGQFETFLNISGEEKLLEAIKKCLASAFGDRVIAYRQEKNISQLKFALSIGIQRMVRSDLASSGIIFTLDTESGFRNVILINSIYGVGEMIVKGNITPDEFYVFKPTLKESYRPIIVKNLGRKTKKYIYAKNGGLKEDKVLLNDQLKFSITEEEVLTLSRWALVIEKHYDTPQDIEWAKDGKTGQLFIVQARPETVHATKEKDISFQDFRLLTGKKPILEGVAIGEKIGSGETRIISGVKEFSSFKKGEVLIAKMTNPDWVPLMRMASAIVTDEGGRTCHSAIVARELGIPAVVGAKSATRILKTGQLITVDCSTGRGRIFAKKIPFRIKKYDLKKVPKIRVRVMVNVGAPEIAFKNSFLPVSGVGLARLEFIIAEKIKVHPLALCRYEELQSQRSRVKLVREINKMTIGYKDKKQYFIDELAEGISQIAAAFWPRPVIIRLSDFKSNEYAQLIGGHLFEPKEENPMIGLRGASRYYNEKFQPAFQLECQAIKKVREIFGLKNIWLMVPFCRTPEEGKKVLEIMAKNGLEKGRDGLKVIVMAEIPSNVILADQFLKIFDGMSIGSNDLTQLVLGLDRDSSLVAKIGDERNEAVKIMISQIIKECKKAGKYIGICGEAPANFPEFVEFLVKNGIESISVNPESAIKTILNIAKIEKELR